MHDILGYVFDRILDATVPILRKAWGKRGCLLASIVATTVLVGLVPAYFLHRQGDDWQTWLILGPLATVVVVVMVTTTFGLTCGSRSPADGTAREEHLGDQKPPVSSEPKRLATQDFAITRREIPSAILRYFQAGTTTCPQCGREISSRAIICQFCDRDVRVPQGEPTPGTGQRPDSTPSRRAEPRSEPLIRCKRCSAHNPPESSFCGECGAAL